MARPSSLGTSQSNVTNMGLVISVVAKMVDRQERQQGKPKQATHHSTLSQTIQDSAAAAASHASQIRAVGTTASDQMPGASSSGQLSDRDGDSQDQLFGVLPSWPTPSVTVWNDIQATVTRAFLTLEWLLRQGPLKADFSHAHGSDARRLMNAIAALIYRLVAGHLLDEKLNMQRVFTSGFLPVLEAWSIYGLTNLDLNTLGQLLLTRMTTDTTLRCCDRNLDTSGKLREICAVQQLAKMFGSQAASALQPVASVALGALYAALSDNDRTSLDRTMLPWSSEQCLGLFRALMKLSELCAHSQRSTSTCRCVQIACTWH
ncbi:hypothetical protein WJX82_006384 [Trebouxia sp. C0006]